MGAECGFADGSKRPRRHRAVARALEPDWGGDTPSYSDSSYFPDQGALDNDTSLYSDGSNVGNNILQSPDFSLSFDIGMGATATTGVDRPGGVADPGDLRMLAQIDGPGLLLLAGQPVWDSFTDRMVLAPPGFSISNYIATAQNLSHIEWLGKVDHTGADWDLKTVGVPTGWGERPYRDAGNILYGATGRANGFSGEQLLIAGKWFRFKLFTNSSSDLLRDQSMINVGINYYDHGAR
jgi:hypothetical protein